jgi:hypothetical protein
VRTALALVLVACCLPRAAHAGRSFYGWLYGTEVMPERGVELQTWIFEENDKYGNNVKQTSLWWGPMIGVTDQLELSLPLELDWTVSDTTPTPSFTLRRFGIEARYRLASPDPAEATSLVPLIRVAAKRDVSIRDAVRLEADGVVSYDAGRVNMLVDVGIIGDVQSGTSHSELRPGAGLSIRATGELRVGAEVYSELSLDARRESWAIIGPDLAWTHGRFWVSGAFGIGIYHVRTAPRVMWGIAF